MKRIFALLLCLCTAFSLTACSGTATAPAASSPASSSAPAESAPAPDSSVPDSSSAEPSAPPVVTGDPNVAVDKVEDTVMGDDGTVLVNYEYQRAVVTLPDADAQVAVQEDLDRELQVFLDYMVGEAADFARDALSYSQEFEAEASNSADAELYGFQPYYGQYTVSPSRVDERVISLVVDSVSYTGGAHGSDLRYCLNYDARTGERLTFDLLGSDFRSKAEKLVLAKAAKYKEQLDEGYEKQILFVVADGTESADEVNRKIYPDLYADTSIEAEEGNLNAEFYLNKKGVMFICGQYVMKPYAGGILEFGIPYHKFGDSFNANYLPADYQAPEQKTDKKDKKEQKKQAAEASVQSADAGAAN